MTAVLSCRYVDSDRLALTTHDRDRVSEVWSVDRTTVALEPVASSRRGNRYGSTCCDRWL